MKPGVFITGATGLIGGEIARRLAAEGRRVWCLVRRKSSAKPATRLERRFALSGKQCDWNNLTAVPGDVTQDLLGLDSETLRRLQAECRYVIHCAADTSFGTPNHCAEVNVTGTRNVLDVCSALGKEVRLFHFSSAFTRLKSTNGIIHEDDPPGGFANDYIKSKRASEKLVLQSAVDAVVLRPSIVLSQGIQSAKFARSLLWIFPVMRKLGVLPLTGEERVDAVSIQFVADCVVRMLDRPLHHQTYHVSAGRQASVTWKQAFTSLTSAGHDFSELRFEPGLDWQSFGDKDPQVSRLKSFVTFYLPFLRAGAVYDGTRLRGAFNGDLPPCPRATDYCAQLLDLFSTQAALAEAGKP